ncbi:hypothetical protein [Pseudarthrobacter phenanthrenivorans]|uniref:hypothetical protein n=1 Tax=Pseudarthrobacter phenanthrenivorans TaxID=361575 RepID=UPI002F35C255
MGAIFSTALSLMLTVGGAAVAAEGGPGAPRQYLVGHVLLGVGIGLLIATALRIALKMVLARPASRVPRAPAQPVAGEPAAVTVLPVRSAHAVSLRGRHAA